MAWNPSPEVAAVRDAANKLESKFAVMVFMTKDDQLCMASYGRDLTLCYAAGKFGDYLLDHAVKGGEKT